MMRSAVLLATAVCLFSRAHSALLRSGSQGDSANTSALRGVNLNRSSVQWLHSVAMSNNTQQSYRKGMPCSCDLGVASWKAPTRVSPQCVFIDLGAADGNTFRAFKASKYGTLSTCPSGGKWEATLVEANPHFDAKLKAEETAHSGQVHALNSHAAYMCEAQTSFYLDKVNHQNNYWGSSMSSKHVDVQASGKVKVTVPTVNVLRLIYETTIPSDYVILKMDIEGAEWDILPCLANAEYANKIDQLLVEIHPATWGNAGTTQAQMDWALWKLRQRGVDVPSYQSQTF